MPRICVIIPTYNERQNLPQLIPPVLEQSPDIDVLVVDDASPDGTGAVADSIAEREPRLHVLHRAAKLGLGTAYVAGFRWALEREYELIFEMDADFSHDPRHMPDFVARARDADLVLGSRYLYGVTVVHWPMRRLLLSYVANAYARAVTGIEISDLTGGYRCYRRSVLAALDLDAVRSSGYAFQIEMTYRTLRRGFRVAEIPILFVDRNVGVSKMSRRIVWEAVFLVWRLRLLALLGKL
ncbi:MAG: polyprenol monophosphomannose synthase [Gemmatimonadetes bacterium]|nr:polyprenol monophosphomannose synthase [Gemmatimonadota bacterium]